MIVLPRQARDETIGKALTKRSMRLFVCPHIGILYYGAGLVVSEMIASEAMIRATKRSQKMATNCADEFPMSVQLAGCESSKMAEAARLNEDRGAAIIDINMGCPVKKVVNGHAGSSLMRDLDHAGALIHATVNAVSLPVTLKSVSPFASLKL